MYDSISRKFLTHEFLVALLLSLCSVSARGQGLLGFRRISLP
jgi:hypothetical protein